MLENYSDLIQKLLILSILNEAIINQLKTFVKKDLSWEKISILLGCALCLIFGIDIFKIVNLEYAEYLNISKPIAILLSSVLTGATIGRGSNAIYKIIDLLDSHRTKKNNDSGGFYSE